VQFPFPAWATRASEAGPLAARAGVAAAPADPFEGLP
jgi:hypothetical protein